MIYIDLLGKQLKSDDVIEVLERDDLDVTYDFDRLHENQPDEYWIAAKVEGVQMRFDGNQILNTMFFYVQSDEGFSPCELASLGVPVFDSRDFARDFATQTGLPVTEGEVDFLGVYRQWIKIDFGSHLHHSEFREGRLHLISVSLPTKA